MRADMPPLVAPGMAWVPLYAALLVLVVMTFFPGITTDASGRSDPAATLLLLWTMSAGFIRGLGLIPRRRLPRWLLSAQASLVSLAMAGVRLEAIGNPYLAL